MKIKYKKYIEGKYLYRAFSSEWLKDIKKNGLNPKINPYENIKSDLVKFFKILDLLEEKKFNYVYLYWSGEKPLGSKISRVHIESLNKKYVDLTLNEKELDYYLNRMGGDIPHTVNHITEDLIKWNYPLTDSQIKLIRKVQKWARLRMKFSMKKLKISATSKYLEKAEFQRFGPEYIPCPYGSFEHFERIIKKYGWKTYKPYLIGEKEFYIRFRNIIPPSEIKFY